VLLSLFISVSIIIVVGLVGIWKEKQAYKNGWIKGYKTGYTEGLDSANANVYAALRDVDVTPLEDVAYMVYEREQE
jgi:hypothetical protein